MRNFHQLLLAYWQRLMVALLLLLLNKRALCSSTTIHWSAAPGHQLIDHSGLSTSPRRCDVVRNLCEFTRWIAWPRQLQPQNSNNEGTSFEMRTKSSFRLEKRFLVVVGLVGSLSNSKLLLNWCPRRDMPDEHDAAQSQLVIFSPGPGDWHISPRIITHGWRMGRARRLCTESESLTS